MQHPLVEHPADAHGPPVVHRADAVGVRHADVREELLAELQVAVQHLDAVHLDPVLADRQHEDRQAAVLRHVPVRARQAEPPVGPPRAGRPHLRPVEHPLLAVPNGGRQGAGDVRAAARLGEELHPDLLTAEHGREVPALLLLGPEVQQHGGARRERRRLQPGRYLVARDLVVEGPLVGRGEAEAPVLDRDAHPGEPGVEEHALHLAVARDLGELLLVGADVAQAAGVHVALDPPEVRADPTARPGPERLDVLGGVGHRTVEPSITLVVRTGVRLLSARYNTGRTVQFSNSDVNRGPKPRQVTPGCSC